MPSAASVVLMTALVLATASASAVGDARLSHARLRDVPTVPSLNVTQYLGLWYQVYTDSFNAIFEPTPYCATAKYGLYPNGSVSVRNIDRQGAYNGTRREVEGFAYQTDAAEYPGRLAVVFPFNPIPGPYWIVKLGPVIGDEYQYAVVTDMDKLSLFVLTRDPATFKGLYGAEVSAFLTAFGFTNALDDPKAIPQGPLCNYS